MIHEQFKKKMLKRIIIVISNKHWIKCNIIYCFTNLMDRYGQKISPQVFYGLSSIKLLLMVE